MASEDDFDIWLARLKTEFAIEDNEQGFHAVLDEASDRIFMSGAKHQIPQQRLRVTISTEGERNS
jgi:hypothetical protein